MVYALSVRQEELRLQLERKQNEVQARSPDHRPFRGLVRAWGLKGLYLFYPKPETLNPKPIGYIGFRASVLKRGERGTPTPVF